MKQFQHIGAAKVGRSMFDLSYEKKFTCDMGQLIPVMCDEVVPGDIFNISNRMLVRMQPMVAPVMHEINAYVHYFFVPYRLLWSHWEEFITGGVNGPQDPDVSPAMLKFKPDPNPAKGSFWDYIGFPVGVVPDDEHLPVAFPVLAYFHIWDEYYRDETLQTELAAGLPSTATGVVALADYGTSTSIKNRNWEKDYFTAALPWQQRGVAPALPISGLTSAVFAEASGANLFDLQGNSVAKVSGTTWTQQVLDNNTVDLSGATTFNVADMRLAFQVQRWLERNARAGARYTESLRAHFGVAPKDERLQRPEYIGGSKTPIIISEVLQTSETATTPQGTLAGHGITADMRHIGKYRVQEYGLIMGIMSIMPRAVYQQGIDRQWLRRTKYDFYFPEFANLSEQAIERAEIYTSANQAQNSTIFGYQGRYDEMRVKRNMVVSEMRDTFDYWHLSRQFSAAPELNTTFVTCTPRKDIFAVNTDPGFIVSFGNIIKAVRPMPIMANPGLIDH